MRKAAAEKKKKKKEEKKACLGFGVISFFGG
jgi:hypothetical protein